MSHFAQVVNNVVVQVIVAEQDVIDTGLFGDPSSWIQTSYNTKANVHYGPDGNPDGGVALRANYAGIGYIYDNVNDVFYSPQPYPSWSLNTEKWIWDPPVSYPIDGNYYNWNEATQSWDIRN